VERPAANLWRVRTVGAMHRTTADIELDTCGTWVTLTHDGARPVVVRRAGWVDLRGHPTADGPTLDRVGLGPGDGIALAMGPAGVEDITMAVLLDGIAADAATLADQLRAHDVTAIALRVPPADVLTAVALSEATGLPASRFAEPLHPVGSPAEELWTARPAPPREARLRVAPERRAVPATRSLLRRLMASWRMPELLDGYLELLATEIVTNAVIHAATELDVTVVYTGEAVRLDVFDRNDTLPAPKDAALDAEGGRGLWMMRELSLAHGIEAVPGGKRVWFTVAA
jgi:hypothetical protein